MYYTCIFSFFPNSIEKQYVAGAIIFEEKQNHIQYTEILDYFTRFTPQKTFSLKTFTEENNYQVTTYLVP